MSETPSPEQARDGLYPREDQTGSYDRNPDTEAAIKAHLTGVPELDNALAAVEEADEAEQAGHKEWLESALAFASKKKPGESEAKHRSRIELWLRSMPEGRQIEVKKALGWIDIPDTQPKFETSDLGVPLPSQAIRGTMDSQKFANPIDTTQQTQAWLDRQNDQQQPPKAS